MTSTIVPYSHFQSPRHADILPVTALSPEPPMKSKIWYRNQHPLFSTMISSFLTYIFTFLMVAISVYFWLQRHSQNGRLPPGPRIWPIIGSIPSVAWQFYRSGLRLPAFLQHLSSQFGPIFTVNLFGRNIIVLCDYDRIKEAFQHPNLSDRPQTNLGTKYLGGDGK